MKTLQMMNNVEKGKMLADLFPDELKGILEAIHQITAMMTENKDEIVANWDNGFITVGMWYRLAQAVNISIKKCGNKLLSSSRFAHELFDGYCAIFTIHCIMTYAKREREGSKFWHMVNALFNFS